MGTKEVVIGICDDEEFFSDQIRFASESYLEDICDHFRFEIFHSGEEVSKYRGDTIDLLFLDIELNGMDGIAAMQAIMHHEDIWRIVFVSSHEERVWDTFSMKTIGFIRKPINEEQIGKYIKEALYEHHKDVIIPFKKNDEDSFVRLSDLYYIEGCASYIKVFSKKKEFIVTGKLGEWEEKMRGMPIVRVHKSYMVNLFYAQIKGMNMYLSEPGIDIPIGRKYKKKVQEEYNDYIIHVMRERS